MDLEGFRQKSIEEQIVCTIERSRLEDYSGIKWICDLYDPPSPKSEKIVPILKIYDFLSIILNDAIKQFPMECIKILRLIARQEGFESEIRTLRGVRIICDLMNFHINDYEIIKHGCIVLGLLATDVEIRRTLTDDGAINLLVQLLQSPTFNKDSQMLVFICRALSNSCYKLNENKISFVEKGGYTSLIQILSSDIIDTKAKNAAALLLRNLCNLYEDRALLIDTVETAIDDFLSIAYTEYPHIQIHLIWTILNLTINDGRLKRQFGEKGGIVRILEIMRKHFNDCSIQTIACTALLQLSKKQFNRIAIGKNGGVSDIIKAIRKHVSDEKILDISLPLLDILCVQGVNRKRLTQEKGLLNDLMRTLKENLSNQQIVVSLLRIVHRIACGANKSKYELRAANALPMFTEVITTYTSMPDVRNLANNCISDIFKPSQREEEDSNDSFSSGDSDSDDSEEEITTNYGQYSPPTNKRPFEGGDRNKYYKYNFETSKLQEELTNERFARKRLEDEVANLKQQLRLSEERVHRHLEILNLNQQLQSDLEFYQQQVTDLVLQNETYQKKIDTLVSQYESDANKIRENEQKLCTKEINKYKVQIEDLQKIIEKQKQEQSRMEIEKKNLVEDTILFHWMTVAIRLDLLMHNGMSCQNFDKTVTYDKLKRESVSYEVWPKRISDEMMGPNQSLIINNNNNNGATNNKQQRNSRIKK